jgi:hypothetical protein
MAVRVLTVSALLALLALLAGVLNSAMESAGVDARNAVNARHVVESSGPRPTAVPR